MYKRLYTNFKIKHKIGKHTRQRTRQKNNNKKQAKTGEKMTTKPDDIRLE